MSVDFAAIRRRERERTQRNLHPHKAAVAAMYLWAREYSQQRGGSMDFWDGLPDQRKMLCHELVKKVVGAPPAGQERAE